VADIVSAIETAPSPHASADKDGVHAEGLQSHDLSQDLWDALHTTVMTYLQTITLSSLAAEQRAKGFQVKEKRGTKKLSPGISQPKYEPIRTTAPNSVFALAQTLA
jgi:Rrf2 family transcriptional regulator, iron-sulfur cluster assembly transcription factor